MSSFFVTTCMAFAVGVLLQLPHGNQIEAQELFAFPADVVVSSYLENAQNRTPVYIPGKCGTNEILYPGDHDNDWVCDCKPGYVYSPREDSCYPLFERGFCQPGEYVDLARPSMIVQCTKNVCQGKGELVPYKGQCVHLHRNNKLCPTKGNIRLVIGVNITTLELDCVRGTLEILANRNTHEDEESEEGKPMKMQTTPVIFYQGVTYCHNGTKAMYNGKCN
uniref:DUF4789 domain-containing protein n=1 Tax=Anopheles farauti TaxID=69004 RepID=A0A182R0A9_9DIPT